MTFYKYQGTGNDFILFDNREQKYSFSKEQVAKMCHRRFGIGADGLMLLENEFDYDFRMVYYNSDGGESTMCGNGGRCMVAFAKQLGIINDTAKFIAIDGPHYATISADGIVNLQMQDVTGMDIHAGYTILNTGSPHYVKWVNDVKSIEVFKEGRSIRQQPDFMPSGINVNFTQVIGDNLHVRTYERGVEDETYSCGTGVTAAAIAATCSTTGNYTTHIHTPGGDLSVSFTKDTPTTAKNVILTGPAIFVFQGTIYGI
jgi:diaminopimelate epimerase